MPGCENVICQELPAKNPKLGVSGLDKLSAVSLP